MRASPRGASPAMTAPPWEPDEVGDDAETETGAARVSGARVVEPMRSRERSLMEITCVGCGAT